MMKVPKNHIALLLLLIVTSSSAQVIVKRAMPLMGCSFDITVVAPDQLKGEYYIDAAVSEIERIEELISSWNPNSQTSQINQMAGIKAVKVDTELFELISRSMGISKLTDGAFDISYASMDRIWRFDGSTTEMPDKMQIEKSVAKVGYNKIELDIDRSTVYLKEKGMKIAFGAIGKGYAADRCKALLIDMGVVSGIINASGDMSVWGLQPDGSAWKVAITNPMMKNKSYGLLPITDGAVVTSGNYEKYLLINGQRYAHIIDPRSGYPASGILSVTVFAPKAELADALATSIFVMGRNAGIDRINQLPNIECIIIDDSGDIHKSNNIEIDTQ